jgi:hypothetical protein
VNPNAAHDPKQANAESAPAYHPTWFFPPVYNNPVFDPPQPPHP